MSAGDVYVVQKGDTLSEIAAKHNTTVEVLQKLNGISNPNLIRIGQKLRVK
ncbi:MAG: LysM peptidoglycan-binding domain-containing protein [Anoxybacillus gonensis]|nr:LysM peptidoglycan-binding domain-containing protein [Anoxybacillus gonensis]